jgi:protein ImuA
MSVCPRSAAAELSLLRDRIRRIERPGALRHGVLPFGSARIDAALPGGGLALGALHEILAAGPDEEDAAVSAGFAATILGAILGRLGRGAVLWCLKRLDLHGPGLAAHGLDPDRLILARATRDADILWAVEEGLRTPGLAAVVGEVGCLPMVAGRRLQLAAEHTGVTAFVLRRWHTGAAAAAERERPSAAVTRWRVAALPSLPPALLNAAEPGIGQPRWRVELLRCRGGVPAAWDIPSDLHDQGESDATDPLSFSAGLADRPAAPRLSAAGRHRGEGRRAAR